MSKINVITVVGTRPEIIRLSRIIPKLDKFTNHTLIHTGQNYDYELNEIFFRDLEIRKPDFYLDASDKNANQTIGKILISIDELLEKIKPEAVLVLGDTNSCISILAAKKRKIPTFHFEAGNRCFDTRVPEETNRKIIDHIADINITYSSIAREYLIHEGIKKDTVIKIGSPMFEVINFYKQNIHKSKILKSLNINKDEYFLASIHREENIDSINFEKIIKTFNSIVEKYEIPIIFSTHPRTRKKIDASSLLLNKKIKLINPLSFSDYLNLQINSKVVLSDSGTISEESSILGFHALNIRESHERPEAMEEACVIMTGVNSERIIQSLEILLYQKENNYKNLNSVNDYNINNVSEKILRIIVSYTDYVKRNVWQIKT